MMNPNTNPNPTYHTNPNQYSMPYIICQLFFTAANFANALATEPSRQLHSPKIVEPLTDSSAVYWLIMEPSTKTIMPVHC